MESYTQILKKKRVLYEENRKKNKHGLFLVTVETKIKVKEKDPFRFEFLSPCASEFCYLH